MAGLDLVGLQLAIKCEHFVQGFVQFVFACFCVGAYFYPPASQVGEWEWGETVARPGREVQER